MGSSWIKAIVTAAILLAPGLAAADPLFDAGPLSPDFQLFPFWQNVLRDMNGTAAAPIPAALASVTLPAPAAGTPSPLPAVLITATPAEACVDERHCIPKAWIDFLSGVKTLDARSQLDAVNRWANAKPYVDDMTNWALPDYWETPGEFLARGGDCEDYAIAKYFSLVRLGFASSDLRIVIVSDSQAHDFHAVLVARLDGTDWLLDNQLHDVVALAAEPRYTPVYALNEQGWSLESQLVIQVSAGITIVGAPLPAMAVPVHLAALN